MGIVTLILAAVSAGLPPGSAPGGARPAELAFPLRDGVSSVGQGGGGTVLNYHHPNRAQAFATDIVALKPAGLHAWGLSPSEPGRYALFDRAVHSPCTGRVLETHDGLGDLNPPATDRENLAGNHVVLRCAGTDPGVDVLLAHLRQGSVAVEPGTQVQVGQVVGRVGNTGNTSEPHLHVHAVRTGSGSVLTGEGVPIRFDGRFLVRNSLVLS